MKSRVLVGTNTGSSKFAHPADQQTLCCKDAAQVKSYIGDLCPSSMESDALSAFKTACEQAGYGCMLPNIFARLVLGRD